MLSWVIGSDYQHNLGWIWSFCPIIGPIIDRFDIDECIDWWIWNGKQNEWQADNETYFKECECTSHSQCTHPLAPFCYEFGCTPCSECHYCFDGVDGTCGNCGDGYPLYGDTCSPTSSPTFSPSIAPTWNPTQMTAAPATAMPTSTPTQPGL